MLGYKINKIASSQVCYVIWSPLLVFEQETCVLKIFYALQDLMKSSGKLLC